MLLTNSEKIYHKDFIGALFSGGCTPHNFFAYATLLIYCTNWEPGIWLDPALLGLPLTILGCPDTLVGPHNIYTSTYLYKGNRIPLVFPSLKETLTYAFFCQLVQLTLTHKLCFLPSAGPADPYSHKSPLPPNLGGKGITSQHYTQGGSHACLV